MINSRDPDKLIPSVAKNCKALLEACAVAGFKAGLSCTYRDQEYQTYLHATVGAPRMVSFHAWGLAFDIFENLNGKTSYRKEFFDFVAPLAKKMGFTWMHDITRADKPHFQWDDGRKYTGSMVRAGKIPRAMPLYKGDEIDMYIEEIAKKANVTTAAVVDALAEYVKYANAKEDAWEVNAVQKLRQDGVITSDHPGNAPVFWGELAVVVANIK